MLSVCVFYLTEEDQVAHKYKTKGKIAVLYMMIFTFLDGQSKYSQPNGSRHVLNFAC
jgi:hypothetical protein